MWIGWKRKEQIKKPINLFFDKSKVVAASLKNQKKDWFIIVVFQDQTMLEFELQDKEEGETVIKWLHQK